MSQHLGVRIGGAQLENVGGGEAFVHLAAPLPGDDLDVGLARDVAGEELVGDQDDAIDAPFLGDVFDHLHGVGAGAADIGLGLHVGRGVHIGHDRQARIALLDQPHVGAGDRGGEAASGQQVGDQHGLFRRQDLRRLGHEVHAGLDDDLGVGLGRFLGQAKAVADIVAHAVEDLGRHVVVGEDDGVFLALQPVDLGDQRSLEAPLHRGDVMLDLFPQGKGGGFNRGRERKLRTVGHGVLLMLNLSISSASKNAAGVCSARRRRDYAQKEQNQ